MFLLSVNQSVILSRFLDSKLIVSIEDRGNCWRESLLNFTAIMKLLVEEKVNTVSQIAQKYL